MMSDVLLVLLAVAAMVSLPAAAVAVGLAFHSSRSRAFLLRHGKLLVVAGFLAWGACLIAHLALGAPGWGTIGSVVGLTVSLGVAIARNAAAQEGAA